MEVSPARSFATSGSAACCTSTRAPPHQRQPDWVHDVDDFGAISLDEFVCPTGCRQSASNTGEQSRPAELPIKRLSVIGATDQWQAQRRRAGSSRAAASARSRLVQASHIARHDPASMADE